MKIRNRVKKINFGFTFVELIVAVTIIIILTTIGFISYGGYLTDARDSQRKSDMAKTLSALKLYKIKRGIYPNPGENFNLVYSGAIVAVQGVLNKDVILSTLDKIPLDPLIKVPYFYSITKNKQESQLSLTLENGEDSIALLEGTYKTVSKNILPTIILATRRFDTDIVANSDKFIFNNGKHNTPYKLDENDSSPYSDLTPLITLISDPNIIFWQNTDYRSCSEIKQSGRSIGNGEYQIVNSSGALTNTGCTF